MISEVEEERKITPVPALELEKLRSSRIDSNQINSTKKDVQSSRAYNDSLGNYIGNENQWKEQLQTEKERHVKVKLFLAYHICIHHGFRD